MSHRFFKEPSRRVRAFVFVSAVTSLIVISAAQGQTPAPASPAGQIGPGNTGSITPAQGVSGAPRAAQPQALKDALSPATRQTLQDAMNSVDVASNEVDLGPGEAAELDGTTANKIAFAALPDKVKQALNTTVQNTLGGGTGR